MSTGHVYDIMYPYFCKTHMRLMTECDKAERNCPSCLEKDAELTRLRPLAARAEDVEGIGATVYRASNDFQSDESVKFGAHWKDMWPNYIARAVVAYLKEGK
jgi:hypothetical protein